MSAVWVNTQQLQRPEALLERSLVPDTTVAASRSVAGASCGSSNCNAPECCRILLPLGASQERSAPQGAGVAESWSEQGAFCGYGSHSGSVQVRFKSAVWLHKKRQPIDPPPPSERRAKAETECS